LELDANSILIVDDEENIRHMLSMVLGRAGFNCDTAADGLEGLTKLRKRSFEIVLCDINMPRMTGMELLVQLEKEAIESTVIMITAFGSVDTAIEAMKLGAYDYVQKPFKPDEVLLTIRKARERERLRRQNRYLRSQLRQEYDFSQIISYDPQMQKLFEVVRKVARFKSTVLIGGESGTGKELFARSIHFNSDRSEGPFVTLNCGAIPENLIESELFGHEKGAFTDAVRMRRGLFEEANGGTLLLDEIGELPIQMQVKLLRVLQEEEVRRVGSDRSFKVDVRIIAASAQNLSELVKEGRFREDLYYRLNVVQIDVPPLRDRASDIPLLVKHFIGKFNERLGLEISGVDSEAMRHIEAYHWPGNVRELENTIERAMVLCDGIEIGVNDLPAKITERAQNIGVRLGDDNLSIKKHTYNIENQLIRKALEKTNGNRTAAARLLEISHRALLYKIKEYQIEM